VAPERIWIAPQKLVDVAVGEVARKALFAFAQSIGLSVVNARQKPKLGSVINYHEPSAIS
jgi:hypothetical protein